MTKGNVLEHSQAVNMKESRTAALLRKLNVEAGFLDPKLPKGFFSNSQYNSWLICGKAYEFKYVQQISTPDYASTSRGNAVHAGVEHMLRAKLEGKPVVVEEGHEVVSKTFDEKAKGVLDWGDQEPGKVKDLALRLFKTYTTYGLPYINPVAIEEGFAKKLGDVPMIGWIDLVDEQPAIRIPGMTEEDAALAPKRLVTADLKTSKAKWSDKEVALDPQLTIYSHVKGTPNVRVDQLIDHKKAPTFLQANSTRTPRDVELVVEHINEVADMVKKVYSLRPQLTIGAATEITAASITCAVVKSNPKEPKKMAIKLSTTCTRCHREDAHEIESFATATAFEELQKRKVTTLAKLQAFIKTLPPDELPDFFAVLGDKTMVHSYLCDPPEAADGKGHRSCAKRVGDLLEGVNELGPRKPKTKKEKPAE